MFAIPVLSCLFSIVVIYCSAVSALPVGSNSTLPGAATGANNSSAEMLGGSNATTPEEVGGNSTSPSNQSAQTTPAPTAGSPPPILLQGSVSILPPYPQQTACPQMCQSNQGCQPPCPRPCCQQQQQPMQQPLQQPMQQPLQQSMQPPLRQPMQPPLQQPQLLRIGRSAVPRTKKCQCQVKCSQKSRKNQLRCLVRCERVCGRKENTLAFASAKREGKRRFHSNVVKIRKNRKAIKPQRLIKIKL